MLLLHISDIHFRAPDCLNPALDPDRPYRTRLLQDVRDQVANLGPVTAVLVGGDIAFKGAPEEYQTAMTWLTELAAIAGCPMERVFVVPGNHDVDRAAIGRSAAVRNAQGAICQAQDGAREREFRTQISDPETAGTLLVPLVAYNDFAKVFNCQVFLPDRLYWRQDLDLGGGVVLRIHGLTSTILSGRGGQDDTKGQLYLSPLQTVLDPVDDVANLVICHHPPDWFIDHEDADEAICNRAQIQLFGHKHRHRVTRDESYIRFNAGAVNPDRHEPGWQPGYNLIGVRVQGEGQGRKIVVEGHVRQWQSNPDQFIPVLVGGRDVFRHEIAFPGRVQAQPLPVTPEPVPVDLFEVSSDAEASMGASVTRNLVFRFWNLSISQRRDIAVRLGLITEDEMSLPEPERYGRALIRAGERGMLSQLADAITEKENH